MWAKAGQNRASVDSPEKRIMLDLNQIPTDSFIGHGRTYVRLSLKIPSQYETYT